MSGDKFKIIVDDQREKEEIELANDFSAVDCQLVLEKNGRIIKSGNKLADPKIQATLKVYLAKENEIFPDQAEDFVYYLKTPLGNNYKRSSDGKIEIITSPQEQSKIQNRINNLNGKLIWERFGKLFEAQSYPVKGFNNLWFKIRKNAANEPENDRGVRIDLYPSSEIDSEEEPIRSVSGKNLEIRLIWNYRGQKDVRDQFQFRPLINISPVTSKTTEWKWRQIALVGGAISLFVLGLIFLLYYQKIKSWWRRRKNQGQLEVF